MKSSLVSSKINFVLVFKNSFNLNAQTKKYPADIEVKIRQVENKLAGRVQAGNSADSRPAETCKNRVSEVIQQAGEKC